MIQNIIITFVILLLAVPFIYIIIIDIIDIIKRAQQIIRSKIIPETILLIKSITNL